MAEKLRDMSTEWKSEMANDPSKISWLVSGNPKRPHGKSHKRFENYFGATTVEEYLESGGTKADLRYDFQHRFLDIEPVEIVKDEPEAEPAKPEVKGKGNRTGKIEAKTDAVDEVNEILG